MRPKLSVWEGTTPPKNVPARAQLEFIEEDILRPLPKKLNGNLLLL